MHLPSARSRARERTLSLTAQRPIFTRSTSNTKLWRMAVQFKYIATNPQVLGGKPIIKGTRISVEFILELVASGASVKDIVAAYPDLPEEAVKEAMEYAAASIPQKKKNTLTPLYHKKYPFTSTGKSVIKISTIFSATSRV